MSKTEIIIHEVEEKSDDVIDMSDMKLGQFGKIVHSENSADLGIYVMRTQESNNFEILDMSGFAENSSWDRSIANDNDIRVKILDVLIEVHVLEDGKTIKNRLQKHIPICTCNTKTPEPEHHAKMCAVRLAPQVKSLGENVLQLSESLGEELKDQNIVIYNLKRELEEMRSEAELRKRRLSKLEKNNESLQCIVDKTEPLVAAINIRNDSMSAQVVCGHCDRTVKGETFDSPKGRVCKGCYNFHCKGGF